jgi:hypothetical protein
LPAALEVIMADVPPGNAPSNGGVQAVPPAATAARPPFPVARLMFAIGYGFVAWVVFCVILTMALIQFVVLLIDGATNAEIKKFSLSLVQYLWELLAYITFVRDEQPFPVGPFPKQA